jgi:hypothetical protein
MAQGNVFGHLLPGTTPQASTQPPAQDDPILRPADPYKASAEQRAQRDQQLQEVAAAREAERLRMAQESSQRDAQSAALGTESERTAGFLAGRISDAVKRLAPAVKTDPSAQGPTVGVEAVRKIAGDSAANYFTDAERQQVRAAQRDILDAALTLGTGAAYTREQLAGYEQSYLPQLFDDPATIASKRQALRTLLQEASRKAGRSAPDIEAAIQALDQLPDVGAPEDPNREGLTGVVTDDSPATGSPLSGGPPDQSGIGGLIELGKQGITLGLSDEAAGVGGAIGAGLTGNDPMAAYTRERDLARGNIDRARKEWPVMGTVAELLGGGGAVKAITVPNRLAQVARQGAGLGAAAGFGYGEGGESVPNALIGGATGGALGAGLYGASRGLNALSRSRGNVDMEVVSAGQRQNIPVRQPDARPELRGRMAQVESTANGGPLVRAAREADAAAMEGRIAEVGGQGNPSDPYALGTQVQKAGERYIANTRQQANRLYEKARTAAGGATVTARNADAVLDANIKELRAAGENSNGAAIKYLEGLRADIDRGLSLESVQNLRTNMRGQISQQGLTGTDTERRVGQVIDAMNQDLVDQLPKAASSALSAADAFYKKRQTFINDTLKQFMGSRNNPLPAETAASRLVSMAQGKGNYERFSRMWGQLEPSEQADVAATVAASLGRARNGDFSPAMLIKNLDPRQGINPRTATMIFGPDGARALQDLRILASAKTAALGRQSPSGVAINAASGGLKTLMMSALGFSTGGPAGAVAGGAARELISKWGEQRAARMLLNPDFTKWLRNAPNTTSPKVIDQYFSRLGAIGSIAANDNAAFTSALRAAVGRSPGTVSAQQEQDTGQKPPQQ